MNKIKITDLEEFALWSSVVKDRIRRINFVFPTYIQHPILEAI